MRRFTRRPKRKSPRIEIIPMVDVMFLLLVFYVLSSLALSQHKGIEVRLPSAETAASSASLQQIVITVNAQGEVYLMTQKVPVAELGAKLEELCETRPGGLEAVKTEGVILNADQTSQMRETVSVMDQMRQIGVYNFSISTQEDARP